MSEPLNHYDCDARERALAQPTLTVAGYRFQGRLLSIVEWLPFLERLDGLNARQQAHAAAAATNRETTEQLLGRPLVPVPPAVQPREWIALQRDYLRAVFPPRLRPWWMRGWVGTYDPVRLIERSSNPRGLADAYTSFFHFQARAMEENATLDAGPSESPSQEPGNTSSGSTAPASDDDVSPSEPSA